MIWNLLALAALATALPQIPGEVLTGTVGNETVAGSAAGPDKNGKYQISGEGIRANFIPYGASISNLFLNDTSGVERDGRSEFFGLFETFVLFLLFYMVLRS